MNIDFINITAEEFSALRNASGMKSRSVEAAKIALKNTLFMVGLRNNEEKLIAFGRVTGDGATSFVVNDIMVDKLYQRQGLGTIIMNHINEYLDTVSSEDSFITLVADIPADKLYEKFGFKSLNKVTSKAMYRPQVVKKQDSI